MSNELPNRRSAARFLTELDLKVLDASGTVLDGRAQAHDCNRHGFKAETRAPIAKGAEFRFELSTAEGEPPIPGVARAMWVENNPWGGINVGAKIVKISWADSRRLASAFRTPGYDFVGLAGRVWKGALLLVVILGFNQLLYHEPQWRKVFSDLTPVMIALVFFGWALLALVRKD